MAPLEQRMNFIEPIAASRLNIRRGLHNSRTPFLSLPLEIRNHIIGLARPANQLYIRVRGNDDGPFQASRHYPDLLRSAIQLKGSQCQHLRYKAYVDNPRSWIVQQEEPQYALKACWIQNNLLATCRQIYNENFEHLFKDSIFSFVSFLDLESFSYRLSGERCRAITKLELFYHEFYGGPCFKKQVQSMFIGLRELTVFVGFHSTDSAYRFTSNVKDSDLRYAVGDRTAASECLLDFQALKLTKVLITVRQTFKSDDEDYNKGLYHEWSRAMTARLLRMPDEFRDVNSVGCKRKERALNEVLGLEEDEHEANLRAAAAEL